MQVGAAAAVFASRQAALRALRELHRAQLQVEVESEAQVGKHIVTRVQTFRSINRLGVGVGVR